MLDIPRSKVYNFSENRGLLTQEQLGKTPNLLDGMTMFYAAGDAGKSKAQNLARNVAYTERKFPITQPTNNITSLWNKVHFEGESEIEFNNDNKNPKTYSMWNNTANEFHRRFPKKTVTADSLRIRNKPGLGGEILGNFWNGEEVIVDIDSAVKTDGYTWVKIISSDKVGWIAAEYLEDVKPKENLETTEGVSYDEPAKESKEISESEGIPLWDSNHVGWAFLAKIQNENNDKNNNNSDVQKYETKDANEVGKPKINTDLLDTQYIQNEFNKVGDFDNYSGLQCPDLPNWYISTYTNLKYGGGDGKNVVDNLVATNSNLSKDDVVTDPSKVTFPAVYSVAANTKALGTSGSKWGHTGLIVGVNEKNGTFLIVHTWNELKDQEVISSAKEYPIPKDGVKYLNLDKFMKQE